jgi:hypothetical protein
MEAASSRMSVAERIYRISVVIVFVGLAIHVFRVADWHWHGTPLHPRGVHLVGWPKNLLAIAMCSAAVSQSSLLVLHYHSGASERTCRAIARVCAWLGWALLCLSFVLYAYQYSTQ